MPVDPATLGRFFVEAQRLYDEKQITLEGIARLRNALHDDIEPLDIEALRVQQAALRRFLAELHGGGA